MAVTSPNLDEHRRRQRTRSIAIGLALAALVVLFYVATIIRLGPNALRREGGPKAVPSTSAPASAPPAAQPDCKKAGTC